MTIRVRIQILITPNHEIPSGVYHDEDFIITDAQWQNMRSALSEFEVELMSMSPHDSTEKTMEVED